MSHHISHHIVQKEIPKQSLFTDLIQFKPSSYFHMDGFGALTGSSKATTVELATTGFVRLVLVLGDTYTNNISLSDNNTIFQVKETGTYLICPCVEIYDNAATAKEISTRIFDVTAGDGLYNLRKTFVGSSTGYEYTTLSGSFVAVLTSGRNYWVEIASSAGGYIGSNTTNWTLMKMTKAL